MKRLCERDTVTKIGREFAEAGWAAKALSVSAEVICLALLGASLGRHLSCSGILSPYSGNSRIAQGGNANQSRILAHLVRKR